MQNEVVTVLALEGLLGGFLRPHLQSARDAAGPREEAHERLLCNHLPGLRLLLGKRGEPFLSRIPRPLAARRDDG